MNKPKAGKYVKCAWCGESIYRIPSRIRKYNFCCHKHRILYAKSPRNKDFGKGWHHKPAAIIKITQANFDRDYDVIFTKETRKKLAKGARDKVWTKEARENARKAHLGKRLPLEQIQKIRENAPRGWKNSAWKGRFASPTAKHMWIYKHYIGPKICAYKEAGLGPCKGRIEFSNKNHLYYKRLKDWQVLCKFHHDLYDFRYGIRGLTDKTKRMYERFGPIRLRDFTIDGMVVKTPPTTP